MPFNLERAKRNWERLSHNEKEQRLKEIAATSAASQTCDLPASPRDAFSVTQNELSCAAVVRTAGRIEVPDWTAVERAASAAMQVQRVAQLESQHFNIKHANALRVRFFLAKLGSGPLEVHQAAKAIAAVSAGKYERGERLLALMRAATLEGIRLAEMGTQPPPTPAELKHVRLELTRMGSDYDKAVEYVVSNQCSEMECANRAAALALLLIDRAHGEAMRSHSRALPAGTVTPLGKVRKRTSSATRERQKAGDATRATVKAHIERYVRAGMEIDSDAKAEIARAAEISVRRVGQIIQELGVSTAPLDAAPGASPSPCNGMTFAPLCWSM